MKILLLTSLDLKDSCLQALYSEDGRNAVEGWARKLSKTVWLIAVNKLRSVTEVRDCILKIHKGYFILAEIVDIHGSLDQEEIKWIKHWTNTDHIGDAETLESIKR